MVEGLLKEKELLESDNVIAPDHALYEVANSIWKHQHLLKDIRDGLPYLNLFLGLIDSGAVRLVHPWNELIQECYRLASEHRISVYDAAFLALSWELGLRLRTFDERLARLARV